MKMLRKVMCVLTVMGGMLAGASSAFAPQATPLFAVLNVGNVCNDASPPVCGKGDLNGFGSATIISPRQLRFVLVLPSADSRPILGGKVVIQAKRYKNTVGVSSVRDLFGTMHNEGASKGILVTTSGYGKAAYDFAKGKPIELITGGNLLYLLKEHADIEAKIEVPDDWIDTRPGPSE